jgi:hypothetical protein
VERAAAAATAVTSTPANGAEEVTDSPMFYFSQFANISLI